MENQKVQRVKTFSRKIDENIKIFIEALNDLKPWFSKKYQLKQLKEMALFSINQFRKTRWLRNYFLNLL